MNRPKFQKPFLINPPTMNKGFYCDGCITCVNHSIWILFSHCSILIHDDQVGFNGFLILFSFSFPFSVHRIWALFDKPERKDTKSPNKERTESSIEYMELHYNTTTTHSVSEWYQCLLTGDLITLLCQAAVRIPLYDGQRARKDHQSVTAQVAISSAV